MFEDFRIKVFLTVAEEGSFTRAAAKLGVSQPAVSQNISELEKSLGGTVLNRERGKVSLTEKGQLFKGYAEQIMHWYNAANEAFAPDAEPVRPQIIELPNGQKAEIWTSGEDIHIHIP